MGRRRCVLGRRRRRWRQRPHEHKSSSPARERSKRGALCGEPVQLHIAKRERSVRAHVGSGAAEERNAKSKPLQLWPTSQSRSAPLCLSRSHFSLFRSLGCSSAVSAPSAFPSDASVVGSRCSEEWRAGAITLHCLLRTDRHCSVCIGHFILTLFLRGGGSSIAHLGASTEAGAVTRRCSRMHLDFGVFLGTAIHWTAVA
ncbi:hypothetical protein L1887_55510 [Cichorium endivia]|nr:hypothetical protein L1887_55510 [Cichorium endivia]